MLCRISGFAAQSTPVHVARGSIQNKKPPKQRYCRAARDKKFICEQVFMHYIHFF
jgi:hypothetical protein